MRDTQEAAASKAHVVVQDHPWSPTTTAYLQVQYYTCAGCRQGFIAIPA